MEVTTTLPAPARLDRNQIEQRLRNCARLPSLSSINLTLKELLNAEHRYTSQISDVIRRDPSMTTRLLRLVNSVYYGLSSPVSTIEEALLYLGVRQVRQLATVTPVIEDLQKLAGPGSFPWREFWQHCLGTAVLSHEMVEGVRFSSDEVAYVSGLLHDVGKIVMAAVFPDHFAHIQRRVMDPPQDLLLLEHEVLGMDHGELGGFYLQNHYLPDVIVESARFHHTPERATCDPQTVAAVQLADHLVRYACIGRSGNPSEVTEDQWLQLSGWGIFFPLNTEQEKTIARANLKRTLERLPSILESFI